jgi:HEAT repeat protein
MMDLERVVTELFDRYTWAEDIDDLIADLKTGRYGDPIPYLASFLQNPDTALQSYALNAMLAIDEEHALDYVLPLLSDPRRQFAICCWLARAGVSKRAVLPLTEVLRSSPDANARYMAAAALGEMGDERAIDTLTQAVQQDTGHNHEGSSIRDMAASALAAITSRA